MPANDGAAIERRIPTDKAATGMLRMMSFQVTGAPVEEVLPVGIYGFYRPGRFCEKVHFCPKGRCLPDLPGRTYKGV